MGGNKWFEHGFIEQTDVSTRFGFLITRQAERQIRSGPTSQKTSKTQNAALRSLLMNTLFVVTPSVPSADRKVVSTHLPLAWTHSSPLEEQKLLSLLEDLAKMFQPH